MMQWILRNSHLALPENIDQLALENDVSSFLGTLLWRRELLNTKEIDDFLSPSLKNLAALNLWHNLELAAKVIVKGIEDKLNICVWGDYDVDGITSTALLVDFFRMHNIDCTYYIPSRLEEGYGLNSNAISKLSSLGVSLLITVDSGISDAEAVAHAKKLGMTVVITDHHMAPSVLPAADVIFNPRIGSSPCPHLAGVGTAFFLAAAINASFVALGMPKVDIRVLLDLVALGTIADVVSLQGQNRILVQNGLKSIEQANRPGIAALKSVCGFAPTAKLDSKQISFSLAPRINAAGRMGHSQTAVELLLSKDPLIASKLAGELNALNDARKEEEEHIFSKAYSKAKDQVENGHMGIVIYEPDWHPGIIGIVASRITERINLPVFVLSGKEGLLKGSGRSIKGLDIYKVLTNCPPNLLQGFGGHPMAAGLSLLEEDLYTFHEYFNSSVKENFGQTPPESICIVDAILPFSYISSSPLAKELELLQPFGMGNAEPVFVSKPLKVKKIREVKNWTILNLEEIDSGVLLQAKIYSYSLTIPKHLAEQVIRITFNLRINRYNGAANIELRLKDWKYARDANELSTIKDLENELEKLLN